MEISVLIRKGGGEQYNEINIVMHFAKCFMCDKQARVRSTYVHGGVCTEKVLFSC